MKKASRPVGRVVAGKTASKAKSTQSVKAARPAGLRKAAAQVALASSIAKIASAKARAEKAQKPISPAVVLETPAQIMNPPQAENERTTVTKKTDKKTSVKSVAGDALLTPAEGAAQLAAERAETSAAKPVKAPSVKASAPVAAAAEPVVIPAVRAKAPEPKSEDVKTAEKPASAASKSGKSANGARQGFKPHEFIVYPAHGVGEIIAIEEQEVAGFKLELFVISFVKDKMILKVPTPKVAAVGMRKLAEADVVKKALDTLAGRARIKRTMWSRRAQEYEAKINSGDLISIAEVVRDLYRSDAQPEQSYSERQLYEAALDRMAREIVVVQKLTETESLKTIEAQLQKGPRRGKAEVESEEVDPDDADIEEAA